MMAEEPTDAVVDKVLASVDSATDPDKKEKPQYSLRTRLREETEAPFRKARMFVYGGSAVSAGVGAFIAGLRVLAAFIGLSGVQPLNETVRNGITQCTLMLMENSSGLIRLCFSLSNCVHYVCCLPSCLMLL